MKIFSPFFLAISLFGSVPLNATFSDEDLIPCIDRRFNNWGDMEPKILMADGHEDMYVLRFLTSVNDLPKSTWGEFQTTFTNFYKELWKNQDPQTLGIQGSIEDFLVQQFDRAFEDLRTNPNAIFFSVTAAKFVNPIDSVQALGKVIEGISFPESRKPLSREDVILDDRQKPILGIFARRDEYQFEAADADHYRSADCLFLRLLVIRDSSVMKQLPAVAKSLISETERTLDERGLDAWLTVSRHGSSMNAMFEGLGFQYVEPDTFDDGTGNSFATEDLIKHYPPAFYQLFLKDIDEGKTSASDSGSEDGDKEAPSLNTAGNDDDDDPIMTKETLRTSSDSSAPANDTQGDQDSPSSVSRIGDIEDLGARIARANTPVPISEEEVKQGVQEFTDVGDRQAEWVRDFFGNGAKS